MMIDFWTFTPNNPIVDDCYGAILSELFTPTASIIVTGLSKKLQNVTRLIITGVNYN